MPPIPPTQTTTERLLLRRYRPSDSAAYFNALCANQAHLREFMPAILEPAQNVEDVRKVIRWMNRQWKRSELFIWGLWEKTSVAYIGEVYLANPDWQVPSIEVGYFTVQDQGGKGFAVEAARAACRIAFEILGVHRVELQCAADNEKSASVARRCGFTLEGRHRNRHHKKDGGLVDRLWFGLLRSEWEAANEPKKR